MSRRLHTSSGASRGHDERIAEMKTATESEEPAIGMDDTPATPERPAAHSDAENDEAEAPRKILTGAEISTITQENIDAWLTAFVNGPHVPGARPQVPQNGHRSTALLHRYSPLLPRLHSCAPRPQLNQPSVISYRLS